MMIRYHGFHPWLFTFNPYGVANCFLIQFEVFISLTQKRLRRKETQKKDRKNLLGVLYFFAALLRKRETLMN